MASAPGRTVSIIMIEDDEGHARLIEKNIRRSGICDEIVVFRSGRAALQWLEEGGLKQGTGMVLLDLDLPDINGIDILARLKSDPRLHRLPVVVLTTTDDQREIQRCYELGCNVYVTKPVECETFDSAIRKLGLFLEVIELPSVSAQTSTGA